LLLAPCPTSGTWSRRWSWFQFPDSWSLVLLELCLQTQSCWGWWSKSRNYLGSPILPTQRIEQRQNKCTCNRKQTVTRYELIQRSVGYKKIMNLTNLLILVPCIFKRSVRNQQNATKL
jgi:hypothetical protein